MSVEQGAGRRAQGRRGQGAGREEAGGRGQGAGGKETYSKLSSLSTQHSALSTFFPHSALSTLFNAPLPLTALSTFFPHSALSTQHSALSFPLSTQHAAQRPATANSTQHFLSLNKILLLTTINMKFSVYRNAAIAACALGLMGFMVGCWEISVTFEPADTATPSIVSPQTSDENVIPVTPVPSPKVTLNPDITQTNKVGLNDTHILADRQDSTATVKNQGSLRMSNQTDHPVRLALLARQAQVKNADNQKTLSFFQYLILQYLLLLFSFLFGVYPHLGQQHSC